MFESVKNQFLVWYQYSPSVVIKFSLSVLVILGMLMLKRITHHLIKSRLENVKGIYLWSKVSTYTIWTIIVLVLFPIWSPKGHSLVTFLGLLTAGIAIALKDVLANMAGWAYLLLDRPFVIGDRIEICGNKGDVIDIGLFKFVLLEVGNWVDADQSTGRVISVPNTLLFTQSLQNFNYGFDYIWDEIPIVITFESNWKKAKAVFLEKVIEFSNKFQSEVDRHFKDLRKERLVSYQKLTPTIYISTVGSGVLLTVRYLCKVKNRRGTQHRLWEDFLTVLDDHDDIELAYDTQRIFNLDAESPNHVMAYRSRRKPKQDDQSF